MSNKNIEAVGTAGSLSPISSAYAAALANPFDGPLARVPDTVTLLTAVRAPFAKGIFQTSSDPASQGNGYIWMNPLVGAANDQPFIQYNDPNSPTVTANGFSGTNAVSVSSNSEFTYGAGWLQGFNYRVVAAGLRIKYTGNQLTRGGRIVALQEPSHLTLATLTATNLLAYPEARQLSITEEDNWINLLYRPVDTKDFNFTNLIPPWNGINGGYMGFWVSSHDSTGAQIQAFEFEAYVMLEFMGYNVTGKSPSYADPLGHAAVQSVVTSSNSFTRAHTNKSSHMSKALVHASSDYVDRHSSGPHQKNKKAKKSGGNWYDGLLDLVPGALGLVASLL